MLDHLVDRLKRLLVDERGVMAVVIALGLPALIGITGAAVDLGRAYTARAELQNAADSAALAAAAVMVGYDEDNVALAQPGLALDTAHLYTGHHARVALSINGQDPEGPREPTVVPLGLLDQDFTIGLWSFALGDFESQGMSLDPQELSAVRVKLRRDSLSNTPVETLFAKILGIDSIPLAAVSTAFLGWPGELPPGDQLVPPDDELGYRCLPIAVHMGAVGAGGGVEEGHGLTFHSENSETAEWTNFFTWPTNDPNTQRYITGELVSPLIKVGDYINVINGNLSNNTFRALEGEFKTPISQGGRNGGTWENPEPWLVVLPVVDPDDGGPTSSKVVGFLHFYVTGVRTAPDKDITGFVHTARMIPNSATGGGNYGTRAARPVIIQ